MAQRFETVWNRRVEVPVVSTVASIVALEDLLALKRAAGRARDVEDVAFFESISGEGDDE